MNSRTILIVLASVALTLFVGLIALNLTAGEKKIGQRIAHLYAADDAQFRRAMGLLLGPPLTDGNRFETLLNGDEIFPPMLAAIRGARRNINFESYIYWSGTVGREFAEALAERARAGVAVNVLLDWLGSNKLDADQFKLMEDAGVRIRKFHEPHWYQLHRMNNRTHRKLLIVDGAIGFTGGVGIADVWAGQARNPDEWRDTHFRAEGPVVAQMQAVFMDNWIKMTGEVMHGADYFPPLTARGESSGQMFSSSPEGGSDSMRLMYLLAITAATRSIHLSSAYFVPDDLTMRTLVAAARRGVRVRIVTPGPHMDADTVRSASRAGWGELLAAGVEFFEYQPTMYHCKIMIVDGLWASVGSTNFDNRSFSFNDEANLNIFDTAFASRQIEIFEADVARSKAVTLAQWKNRPWTEKLIEHTAALLRTQL